MEIDWITVSAQIVNFLILVWLLQHFLYQPVVRAMDRREQRITDRLEEAKARERQAEDTVRRYEEERGELDRKRDEILAAAKEEAEQEKKRMLEQAREEVAETRTHWQHQVDQEKEEFFASLRRRTAEAVHAIARKALADMADEELEERVAERLIERLKSLDEDTRKAVADASTTVRIASAFELDSTVRGRLTRAVHEHIADRLDVEYTQSPALISGIELTSGGRRLSWSLADYMDALAARIDDAFSPIEAAREGE